MASHYLRKYGVAATVDFELYETDGTDLKTDAAAASGDVTLNRDEAGVETLDANTFSDLGSGYSLVLSIAEMTAARIIVYVIDQGTKAWLDKVLIVETYGHASAMHPFDLSSATVALSSASETQIDAIETDTNEIQGKLPTNKIMGSSVVTDKDDEIDAIKAKTDLIPADPATETNVNANETKIDAIDTVVDAIKLKTDLIPADIVTQLDTNIPAIKAITDLLTLSAIADAVHDEVLEGTTTLRQALRLINSTLYAKTSGGGTNTLVARDVGDTKPRITLTVDANGNRTDVVTDAT